MSFEFTRNGIVYRVHSLVGAGPAQIVVEECEPSPEPNSLEASGEQE